MLLLRRDIRISSENECHAVYMVVLKTVKQRHQIRSAGTARERRESTGNLIGTTFLDNLGPQHRPNKPQGYALHLLRETLSASPSENTE